MTKAKKAGEAPPGMPVGLWRDSASTAEFLNAWGEAVRTNQEIRSAVLQRGINASYSFFASDVSVLIRFVSDGESLGIECSNKKRPNGSPQIDGESLHRMFSGAQNFPIGLNCKDISQIAKNESDAEMIAMLIYLQPRISMIYRELMRNERIV